MKVVPWMWRGQPENRSYSRGMDHPHDSGSLESNFGGAKMIGFVQADTRLSSEIRATMRQISRQKVIQLSGEASSVVSACNAHHGQVIQSLDLPGLSFRGEPN